jgi:hypothetical protein
LLSLLPRLLSLPLKELPLSLKLTFASPPLIADIV